MELNDMEEKNISELLRAKTHIWSHQYSFINSMSLKCAVELGIPDIIHSHGQPMTLSQLVLALQIHPSKAANVGRLMRILVHSGFFALEKLVGGDEDEEGYALTEASSLLLKDCPFSERPFVLTEFDHVYLKTWQLLSAWLKNDNDPLALATPFEFAHGKTIWEFAANEPGFNLMFNEAMASDCLLVNFVLRNKCKGIFEGLSSLVDVGGGTGSVSKALAEMFPHLKCTVLDLPHVVADLQGSSNLCYLGGDMFEPIPHADAILLKWVLHDWGDEDCVKILKNCKDAIIMGQKCVGGKVIIIDMVMGNQDWDEKTTETQLFFDMQMMICTTGGRERNEKEWTKLFHDAGFHDYKIYHILGLRALIELYP